MELLKNLMTAPLFNVIVLGIAFMLVSSATQTTLMIESAVLESIGEEDPGFTANAHVSSAICSVFYAFSNFLGPPVVALVDAKWGMVIGSIPLMLFVGGFLEPATWSIYFVSALFGIGSAILWTAQGQFLTLVSSPKTFERDWGLFWATYASSTVIANTLAYFEPAGVTVVSKSSRRNLFTGLLAAGLVALLVLVFGLRNVKNLRRTSLNAGRASVEGSPPERPVRRFVSVNWIDIDLGFDLGFGGQSENETAEAPAKTKALISKCVTVENLQFSDANCPTYGKSCLRAFADTGRLFVTKDVALLATACFYTGIELGFQKWVYSDCIGSTRAFGDDRIKYVGLSGILTGIGEVTAALLFSSVVKLLNKFGRAPGFMLGTLAHVSAAALAFFTLPHSSVSRATAELALVPSRIELALTGGFLLGFGDACMQTQLRSVFSVLYPDNSAAAFAIYQFSQGTACAVALLYSSYLGLHWQLAIMCGLCAIGTGAFITVAAGHKRLRGC